MCKIYRVRDLDMWDTSLYKSLYEVMVSKIVLMVQPVLCLEGIVNAQCRCYGITMEVVSSYYDIFWNAYAVNCHQPTASTFCSFLRMYTWWLQYHCTTLLYDKLSNSAISGTGPQSLFLTLVLEHWMRHAVDKAQLTEEEGGHIMQLFLTEIWKYWQHWKLCSIK